MLRLTVNDVPVLLERSGESVLVRFGSGPALELAIGGSSGVQLEGEIWLLVDEAPEAAAQALCEGSGQALVWREAGATHWVALAPLRLSGLELSLRDEAGAEVARVSEPPLVRAGIGLRDRIASRFGRGRRERTITLRLPAGPAR